MLLSTFTVYSPLFLIICRGPSLSAYISNQDQNDLITVSCQLQGTLLATSDEHKIDQLLGILQLGGTFKGFTSP